MPQLNLSLILVLILQAGKQLGSFSGAQQQLLKDILAQHAGPAKK